MKLKVINRVTGKLEEHEDTEADSLVAAGSDYDYPSREELERGGRLEQSGTTGQQAIAAAESVGRTATFGAWQGFGEQGDIEARRKTLQEESPGVAFGAQAVGATLPAIATGGVASGVLGAAGLGARGVAAGSIAAEGISGGLADEIEQAAIDQRPVSAGRAMLVGIGGEIVGRAIPAAIKAGLGKVGKPAAAVDAVAGATVTDASQAAGKKAREKVAAEAYDMPPGPERDALLAQTADTQVARADTELADATAKAQTLLTKLADDAPEALGREIEGTAPAQLQWSADVAAELRGLASGASEAEARVLGEAADEILAAKNGRDIWKAAASARKRLADESTKVPPRAPDESGVFPRSAPEVAQPTASPVMPMKEYIRGAKRVLGSLSTTGKKALDDYLGGGYKAVNRHLRGLESKAGPEYSEGIARELSSELEAQISKGNVAAGTVYRQSGRGFLPADLKPGTVVTDPAFISTSQNPLFARTLDSTGDDVLIQIEQRTGVPVLRKPDWEKSIGRATLEREVLLRPNTRLEFIGEGEVDIGAFVGDGKSLGDARAVLRFREVPTAGASASPVSLAGKSLDDLGVKLTAADTFKPDTLDALRTGKGGRDDFASEFATTGRVAQKGQTEQGIQIEMTSKGPRLVDGRHRFTVAREKGLTEVYGQVYQGAKKPGKAPIYEGPIPIAEGAPTGGIRRNPTGARILDSNPAAGGAAPDFSTWDPSDFAKGRGGSKAAGKSAEDYSGGANLGTYQRSIVDGLKQNAGFASTGRVTGDAGKLGSEPTFHVQKDGSVKLTHGRLRLTAARELGRETVYGKVIGGSAKSPELLFEGQVRVAQPGRSAPTVATEAPRAPASPLSRAEAILADRQTDVATWGKAAEGAKALRESASPGPGAGDRVSALEDQLAAAHKWQAGTEKTRQELAEQVARMRGAQDLRSETARAVASSRATQPAPVAGEGFGRRLAQEGAEFLVERAIGTSIPGAGFAIKTLWGALGAQGQAQIKRAARTLLSPLTSQARQFAAPRAAVAMTALERFKGDSPNARAAYESRREMLTQVAGTPQIAGEAMAAAMSGLAKENPSNFVGLARRMTESLQYVALNLPPTVAVSLSYPTGIPITDSELRDVADLWNTAFEPDTAIDAIARRNASPIQMRTLRELHQDIYDEIQREVIVQSPDTFASLDSQTKLSIDIMFGSDGVGGLFATSEAARYVAEAHKRAVKQPELAPGLQSGDQSATVEAAGIQAVRTGVTNRGVV